MSAAFRKAAKSGQRPHRERAQVSAPGRAAVRLGRAVPRRAAPPVAGGGGRPWRSLPFPLARLAEEAGLAGEEEGLQAPRRVSQAAARGGLGAGGWARGAGPAPRGGGGGGAGGFTGLPSAAHREPVRRAVVRGGTGSGVPGPGGRLHGDEGSAKRRRNVPVVESGERGCGGRRPHKIVVVVANSKLTSVIFHR